jgi:hypothetical protein
MAHDTTRGPISVRDRRNVWLAHAEGARWRSFAGAPLYVRAVLAITAALCLALLAGTLNEARVAAGLRQQASQATAANTRLRLDTAAVMREVTAAESNATIEHEAHRLGYFLPGEPWVVTVPAPPASR